MSGAKVFDERYKTTQIDGKFAVLSRYIFFAEPGWASKRRAWNVSSLELARDEEELELVLELLKAAISQQYYSIQDVYNLAFTRENTESKLCDGMVVRDKSKW